MEPNPRTLLTNPVVTGGDGSENLPLYKKRESLGNDEEIDKMLDGVRATTENWDKEALEDKDGNKIPLTPETYITRVGGEFTPENIGKVRNVLDKLVKQGIATKNYDTYTVKKIPRITKEPAVQSNGGEKVETLSAKDALGNEIRVGDPVVWESKKAVIESFDDGMFGLTALVTIDEGGTKDQRKISVDKLQKVTNNLGATIQSNMEVSKGPVEAELPPIVAPEPQPIIEQTPEPSPIVASPETQATYEAALEALRNDLAKTEAEGKGWNDAGISISELRDRYDRQKEWTAAAIKRGMLEKVEKGLLYDPNNLLDQNLLKQQINDELFESLAKKEFFAFKRAVKEFKPEGMVDKAKEMLKTVANTRLGKWYLGLSSRQRMAVSFGVGGLAGLALGAGASLAPAAYLTWRAAKVAASGASIGATNEWAGKKWNLADLEAKRNADIAELKRSGLDMKEQETGLADIEDDYQREKKKLLAKRIGATLAAGVVAGSAVGALENLSHGFGSSLDNRLAPRKGFGTTNPEQSGISKKVVIEKSVPGPIKSSATIETEAPKLEAEQPVVLEKAEPLVVEPKNTRPEPLIIEPDMLFSDKHALLHEAKLGDSSWGLLKDTLGHLEKFKKLTEAQKTFIISNLIDKIIDNPAEYNMRVGGNLMVGDKVDFTKLLEDSKELKEVFKKAEETIAPGSVREKSIILNNQKIAAWVTANPGKKVDETVLNEILNTKIANVDPNVSVPDSASIPTSEVPSLVNSEGVVDLELEETLAKEVAEARGNITPQSATPINSGVRTMAEDVNNFVKNTAETALQNAAFERDIDQIYGESGLLGLIGKKAGVETVEWREMRALPANKVLNYFSNPDTETGLPLETLQHLNTSEKHRNLIDYVNNELITRVSDKIKADFRPYNNENMESFIKRAGGLLMKA